MSQSNKRSRGGSGSGSGSNRSGSQGSQAPRKNSTRPSQPVRRPPAPAASQSPLRANIDRILPPFSGRRYVAIWAAGMVPLVLVLLLLTQCNGAAAPTTSNSANPTDTPVTAAFSNSTDTPAQAAPAQPTDTPAAASSAVSPTVASSTGATGATGGASGQGKYMIIDTAKGRIVAKLHTEPDAKVTNTIANFEKKANAKYFDGLTFHRVEDWVIQGGDPAGNGTGGGNMPSEYNNLPFKAGALGVARGQDPAINNDSQFFIVKSDADYLNGQYTNFGQLADPGSMTVVNQIAIGDKITSIRVENR
jgi:peptidyl-prolyl cis-trans isomerase B (cyclophilin B)